MTHCRRASRRRLLLLRVWAAPRCAVCSGASRRAVTSNGSLGDSRGERVQLRGPLHGLSLSPCPLRLARRPVQGREAVAALKANDGDIVSAIMELTT